VRDSTTSRPLQIAVIAPPWYEIPPAGYGGIEAVCYWLVEGLLRRQHDVTLIAAGEAHTQARFYSTYNPAPSDRAGRNLPEVVHALAAARILDELRPDLIHDHSLAGPLMAQSRQAPTLVTTHRPVDGEDGRYYADLRNVVLVASSKAQQSLAPALPWVGVVHNGIPVDAYPLGIEKDDYVLFLGRFNPDKGPDLAIRVARAARQLLVLAGTCVTSSDERFFDEVVRPMLGPDVVCHGPVDAQQKMKLLMRAKCLLAPIRWNEPFGLAMIEAMACGTPVVASQAGSAPEIVIDGKTGFVRDTVEGLAAAVEMVGMIDPLACREHVRKSFEMTTMTGAYERVYRRVLGAHSRAERPRDNGAHRRRDQL
jgi:glycosyltransferase involved in cell wall biosynthesis